MEKASRQQTGLTHGSQSLYRDFNKRLVSYQPSLPVQLWLFKNIFVTSQNYIARYDGSFSVDCSTGP